MSLTPVLSGGRFLKCKDPAKPSSTGQRPHMLVEQSRGHVWWWRPSSLVLHPQSCWPSQSCILRATGSVLHPQSRWPGPPSSEPLARSSILRAAGPVLHPQSHWPGPPSSELLAEEKPELQTLNEADYTWLLGLNCLRDHFLLVTAASWAPGRWFLLQQSVAHTSWSVCDDPPGL